MKNFIYLSIISVLFAACGSGGGDDPEPVIPPVVNTAPSVPVLVSPADNKLCLDNTTIVFQWNQSTDTEKDAIVYQIQVAKDNAFGQIVNTLDNSSSSTTLSLEKNTAYYWRVKATDSKGLSSTYTTTFKFYTSGTAVVNHLPFAPAALLIVKIIK